MSKLFLFLTFFSFVSIQQGYCDCDYCPVLTRCAGMFCGCPVKIKETECRKVEAHERIKCLEKKAENGDTEAMYFLGAIYGYSLNEYEKAINWFTKAGDGRSLYEAGMLCEKQILYNSYKKDRKRCEELYEKAANLNFERAMGLLAAFSTNIATREKWSIALAKKGKPQGIFVLAKSYQQGNSRVPKDILKTIELYNKAAELGDDITKFKLGEIYFFGNTIAPDAKKGLKLIKESADLGNENAIIFLQELKSTIQELNL